MGNWFSSTRPELRAILEAILVSPRNSRVTIYTDSKAAIEAIQNALSVDKTRVWLKSSNITILAAIKEGVRSKNLNLNMQKVKAHSGLLLNDRADKLAKEGAETGVTADIVEISTKGLTYKPLWQNTLIEIPIRNFVKKITNTIYKAEWTFVRSKADRIHQSRVKDKDWKIFRSLLVKLNKERSRTILEDQRRSFLIKSINRALPTLEKRKVQRPDLYVSGLCIKCKEEEESFEHLTSCSQDSRCWEKEEKRILEEIWNTLDSEEKWNISRESFCKEVIPRTFS